MTRSPSLVSHSSGLLFDACSLRSKAVDQLFVRRGWDNQSQQLVSLLMIVGLCVSSLLSCGCNSSIRRTGNAIGHRFRSNEYILNVFGQTRRPLAVFRAKICPGSRTNLSSTSKRLSLWSGCVGQKRVSGWILRDGETGRDDGGNRRGTAYLSPFPRLISLFPSGRHWPSQCPGSSHLCLPIAFS